MGALLRIRDDVLSYREMCDAENIQTLQRGMNFRMNPSYSVILMSQRANAPYRDRVYEDGVTIEYEGHDVPKPAIIVNEHYEGDGETVFQHACKLGCEGIVSETARFNLQLGPVQVLGENQKPKSAGGETRGGRGLGAPALDQEPQAESGHARRVLRTGLLPALRAGKQRI